MAVSAASAFAQCNDFPPLPFGSPETAVRSEYGNAQYGYAVRLPAGITGYTAADPAPDHGFGILLRAEPRGYLYVDGTYNALDEPNVQSVADTHARWLTDSAKKVLSVSRSDAKLGYLRAVRIVSRYTCGKRNGTFIQDETVALSKDHGIVYAVALLTTEEHYAADRKLLRQLLDSWRN